MTSRGSGSQKAGLAMLNLATFIRRQNWVRRLYQYLPQGFRARVSSRLVAQACNRFVRTQAWEHPLPALPHEAALVATQISSVSVGVNIIGYMRGQFGLAESARMYARALIDAGIPVALHDIDLDLPHGWDDRSLESWIGHEMPHPISIIFVNPDYLHQALEKIGDANRSGRYLIACWFWELEQIPGNWLSAIEHVDEIMVATRFIGDAFRQVTDKPILRVPLPLSEVSDSGLQREDFDLREGRFTFLCTFDFNSWIERKNPFAVVDAFLQAFPEQRDDVCLLVKSINGFRHPECFRHLLDMVRGDARIVVRDDVIDIAHVRSLQRCCDAFVSLHRAEGFGLGLAESMLAGKPVIATNWSGNLEFMDETNSCLVGYRLIPVQNGQYPGADGQQWADANVDEAANWMRRLADEPGLAARIGASARDSVLRTLAPQKAAGTIMARLKELQDMASASHPLTITSKAQEGCQ